MKQKLKIGFFTDTYKPQINGVVSSIESFKRELERLGHEVFVFCPGIDKAKSTDKIIRFRSFKFFFQPEYYISLPFTRHIIKNYWAKNLDIVHAHTPFSLGHLGYYYAFIKKVPFVYTYHTLYPEYVKSYVLKGKVITPRMVEKVNAVFSNRCDLNIAPSVKIKTLLQGYGVTQAIEVLPTGIELEEFKQIPHNTFRLKYGINAKEKVLIYVGRLGKEKNIDFLIKCLPIILRQDPFVKLVIVGDGPAKSGLEKLADKLKLNAKIVFTGYLNKAEVAKAYQQSDLFVFASKTDTQGMVILEAAACGLPIVAVKDEAFSNVLIERKNGFAVPQNYKIFSQKVEQILKNAQLTKAMSKYSKEIAKEFTIENQTQKLLEMYGRFL